MRLRHALLLLAPVLARPAPAQDWRLVDGLRQASSAAAFDTARGRVVTVGDRGETREWDGTRWLLRPVPPLPGPPVAMAFDGVRGVTIALLAAPMSLTTWEFDGSTWTLRTTPVAPSVRVGCGIAFDSARNRTVLFGGGLLVSLADTWEWDGVAWQQQTPATAPSPRRSTAMAFDLARGRTVLFGGYDATATSATVHNDTWEWDGTNWSLRATPAAPAARYEHALAYDVARQVTVLFGTQIGVAADTWEYDGTTWTQRATPMPPQRVRGALAYDPRRGLTVLFGGQQLSPMQDLWEWDGTVWTQRVAAADPAPRLGAAMAHATTRNRSVLFGGSVSSPPNNETWEHDGDSWSLRQPTNAPPPRLKHALWSDGMDVFVFGGLDTGANLLGDTWRYDGVTWQPVVSAAAPSARQFHAVAFDPTSGGALLFGGRNAAGFDLGDTWRLLATGWTQVTPTPSPGPRSGTVLASDLLRQRVVLWGGVAPNGTLLDDTWEWDGNAWLPLAPAHHPTATGQHTMTYEPGLGLTVLLARASQYDVRLLVWLWNGTDWFRVPTPTAVGSNESMTAVAADGAIRLHDGAHLLFLTGLPPTVARYGIGCGSPPARLDADAWPRPGATDFALSLTALGANTSTAVLLAAAADNTPFAGCTRLVQPGGPLALLVADAFGSAVLPLPVPPLPALAGLHVFAQAWSLCPTGLCATAGLDLGIGR